MKRSREQEEQPNPATPSPGPDSPDDTYSTRAKMAEYDTSPRSGNAKTVAMSCLLHHEKMAFASYDEYEAHYTAAHLNRCLDCRANFPSAHILGVHIEDCHDPLIALKRENGEHTVSGYRSIDHYSDA